MYENQGVVTSSQEKSNKMKKEYNRRVNLPIPPLSSLHTKVLMNLHKVLRRRNNIGYIPEYDVKRINPNMVTSDGVYLTNHENGYTRDEIKAELATREHVPNKREAKKIRQERNKKGY